ncbi:hypothetical protein L0V05_08455 [Tabrizicola sp. J26]|uniref:hypothetical protein n=1 Tax=Alitabrizicola rongguiensis TaxID=2909234 RepID=UPI001F1F197B|nr:hypothetical protein [Tabrizicola rongguiensis]MCF1708844.1 hypothetical protein [Tabrizicola rongguiensis]
MLRPLILVALLVLSACKLSLPGAQPKEGEPTPAASAAATDIAVTPLDAAKPGSAKSDAPQPEAAAATAGAKPAAAPAAAGGKPGKPQMAASEVAPTEPDPAAKAAVDAAAEAVQPPPPVYKSPAQLACEKKKGVYSKVGSTGARACVMETRDAGKHCSKKSDCEGQCLARSQTCSPITPLFGCQDILGLNGERMTQCID